MSITIGAPLDANGNVEVNLPVTATQAGYAQQAYVPSTTISAKIAKITLDNGAYVSEPRQLLDLDFNSASTAWSTKIGTNATTMTKAVSNGFMRLNNSAITTTTTGIAIYSWRAITVENGYDYRIKFHVKHSNATATNKQCDIGLGYYGFAAGQAAAMNEFVGFRWTTTGGLLGVLETSQGGAPTSQTENINGNVPFSDNVAREYEIILTDVDCEFWVDGAFYARIAKPTGSWGTLKSISLPWLARVFNSGAASAAATFDIGDVSIIKIGCDDGMAHPFRMAAMGKSSYWWQPDLTTGTTQTHNSPASGTLPTAATGSNTASVLNNTANLGGFFRMNGASISATPHSIVWVSGYQNPANPTAAGAATNARNFYCTSITVAPMIVTTVLAGGGFSAIWFASIGASALTSAGTDADGTTAVAQTADRVVPLGRHSSFAAAAAVGTLETGAGDTTIVFATPLVVYPGQFLKVGLRSIWVNAVVTSGTIDGAVMINGYWD